MSKKNVWGLLVLIVAVILIVVIANSPTKNTSNIKIGATLALTGNLSYIGQSEMNGLILASEEINAAGGINGRKIQIITEDNAGDSKTAVSSVQKLLSVNKVDLMFSAFSAITKAVAPIIKEKKVPFIYAAGDGTVASQTDLTYRDYWDLEQSATALYNKIQADGKTSVKIIGENGDACLLFANTFKNDAASSSVKVTGEEFFPSAETDFRTYLTKLNLKKGDVILACAYRQSQLIIKNMSDLGLLDTPTYQLVTPFLPAANGLNYRELFTKNKTISTWYGFAEAGNTPVQDQFIAAYKARFGADPVADSAYSYDDMHVLANVFGKCFSGSGLDGACYRTEMSKVDYTGVAGRLTFDAQGRSNRDTILIQSINNQWQTIK